MSYSLNIKLDAENALRLLDVVQALHGGDKGYPYQTCAFLPCDDGSVILSDKLMVELSKDQNTDLIPWAYENIASLFD